jgi:hypothetical protein
LGRRAARWSVFRDDRLKREIDYEAGIELVFAHVIAERGSVEFDFLRRKLGRAQFLGCTVAIHPVQDTSAYRAVGIAREAQADFGNLGEKLVARGR